MSSTLPTFLPPGPPGGGEGPPEPPPPPLFLPPKPQPGLLPGVRLRALNGDDSAAAAGSNFFDEKPSARTIVPKATWKSTTHGEKGGQVEADKDIGAVEEVAGPDCEGRTRDVETGF